MRVVVLAIFIGLAGAAYYYAHPHDLFCCQEPFPLLHRHPPRDPVATAQQDQFKAPGKHVGGSIVADSPAQCRNAGGVPYWLYDDNGQQYLTCHAGNVWGETH